MKKIVTLFILFVFFATLLMPLIKAVEVPNNATINSYVNQLIDDYNDCIYRYERDKLDFSTYDKYYPLYRDTGKSFEVICVKEDKNEYTPLLFIFRGIFSNSVEVNITVDSENDVHYYFPSFALDLGGAMDIGIIKNNLFEDTTKFENAEFILIIPTDLFLNDDPSNITDRAKQLYKNDWKTVENIKIDIFWEPFNEKYYLEYIFNDDELREEYNEIQSKIDYDINYSFDLFESDFEILNQNVQDKICSSDLWCVISNNGWYYSISFFIISFIVLLIMFTLEQTIFKKGMPKTFEIMIALIIGLIFTYCVTNLPNDFIPIQIIPPFIPIPLLIIYYYKLEKKKEQKKLMKERKRRKKSKKKNQ